MTKPLLSLREVVKTYTASGQELIANAGVSFDVYPSETVGVVGESGCGKSTLAKLIVQLEQPTGGEIYFDGEAVGHLKGKALRNYRQAVQMVFQDPATSLNPKMRIFDLVAEPLKNYKRAKKSELKKRVADLLDAVDLPLVLADRYPNQHSGGQRQRVNLARALALHPKLVICDESTSALDAIVQESVVQLLMHLQEKHNLTILFISHDLALVHAIAHRVVVMYLGHVVEILPSDCLTAYASHPYTHVLMHAVIEPETPPGTNLMPHQLPENTPELMQSHPACPYYLSCDKRMPLCYTDKPALRLRHEGHWVACHLEAAIQGVPEERH